MFRKKLEQLTAHDKILIFDNFRYLLEALEEYVEKSGYYPNFIGKRQFKYLTISKEQSRNLTLASAEDMFRTRLLIFVGMDTPSFLREEVKEEFYKWINLVGIDVNNCPDRKLKHFLLEIENVVEGKSEKILGQTEEYLNEKKKVNPINPNEMIEIFGAIQGPLNKNRAKAEVLETKTHVEVENENKLKGNWKEGEKAFNQLAGEVSSHHDDFSFYQGVYHNNSQQRSNSEIIQEVKNNPQNWRVDEIITGYDGYLGKPKEEIKLIHRSARMDYDVMGSLKIGSEPIYQWDNFSEREKVEINRALNISQTPTNQPIRWELINNIKRHANEFRTEKLIVSNDGRNYDEETWIIHNSAEMKSDKNGCLVFDPDKMVKVKDLNDAEKEAIGYKSEVGLQTSLSSKTPKNDDKGISKGGIIAIISIIGAFAITGIVVAKKKLNKKVKKV
jgi:hypothetical protein